MDHAARQNYLADLVSRIENGFFFSKAVTEYLAEEIGPVLNDALDRSP